MNIPEQFAIAGSRAVDLSIIVLFRFHYGRTAYNFLSLFFIASSTFAFLPNSLLLKHPLHWVISVHLNIDPNSSARFCCLVLHAQTIPNDSEQPKQSRNNKN